VPGQGDPSATFTRTGATGQVRRQYLLAPQQARSVSGTLRATYSFTPFLTLQTYAQLFTAGISYDDALYVEREPGRRPVTLGELRPPATSTGRATTSAPTSARWV